VVFSGLTVVHLPTNYTIFSVEHKVIVCLRTHFTPQTALGQVNP